MMPCAMPSLRGASGVVGCDRLVWSLVLHAIILTHMNVRLCTDFIFLLSHAVRLVLVPVAVCVCVWCWLCPPCPLPSVPAVLWCVLCCACPLCPALHTPCYNSVLCTPYFPAPILGCYIAVVDYLRTCHNPYILFRLSEKVAYMTAIIFSLVNCEYSNNGFSNSINPWLWISLNIFCGYFSALCGSS